MNYFAVGFGAVALTALGAIDYANQAGAAGEAPGSFSAASYFATYGARVDAVRIARADADAASERDARRKAGARVYLPAAPEGWTRRAWLDGDNSAVEMPQPAVQDNTPALIKNMEAKSARVSEERRDAQSWVYQNADRIIALRAEYQPREDARSIKGAVEDTLAAAPIFARSEGWDIIGGVAYGRLPAKGDAATFTSAKGTPFMAFEAPMGLHDSVRLHILSNAEEADLRAILARIDYDGLNSLLSHPLAHVGSNAPKIPEGAAPQMADLMLALHGQLLARRSAEAQAWLERATTPENAMKMAMNEMANGWGLGGLAALDPGATPASEMVAEPKAAAATPAGFFQTIKSFAGSFVGGSDADTSDAPKTIPKRLSLSGGTSCLEGSAGKFCGN